jgi:hypothetical protein
LILKSLLLLATATGIDVTDYTIYMKISHIFEYSLRNQTGNFNQDTPIKIFCDWDRGKQLHQALLKVEKGATFATKKRLKITLVSPEWVRKCGPE